MPEEADVQSVTNCEFQCSNGPNRNDNCIMVVKATIRIVNNIKMGVAIGFFQYEPGLFTDAPDTVSILLTVSYVELTVEFNHRSVNARELLIQIPITPSFSNNKTF